MTRTFRKWLSTALALLMIVSPLSTSMADDAEFEVIYDEEQTEVVPIPEPQPEPQVVEEPPAPEPEVTEVPATEVPVPEAPATEVPATELPPQDAVESGAPEADAPSAGASGQEIPGQGGSEAQAPEQGNPESGDAAPEATDAEELLPTEHPVMLTPEPTEEPAPTPESVYAVSFDMSRVESPVYVAYGTAEDELPLPASLPAQFSDGQVAEVPVVWFCTGNTYDGAGYIPACERRDAIFYFQATPVGILCDPGMALPAVTLMYEPESEPAAAAVDHEGIAIQDGEIRILPGAQVTIDDILNETGYDPAYRVVNEGTITGGGVAALSNAVYLTGAITGGAYEGEVEIKGGVVTGGAFYGPVGCASGKLRGGSFYNRIGGINGKILVTIEGGEFHGDIGVSEGDGYVFIEGGTFYCNVFARNLTVGDAVSKPIFYNADGQRGEKRTVTLGVVGVIASGTFYADVLNRNNIIGGTFYGKVTNGGTQRNCNVLGGTFYGEFDNAVGGKIANPGEGKYGGASFPSDSALNNDGVLDGGAAARYSGGMVITNRAGGTIQSGTYPCKVINYGTISGGTFDGGVVNRGGVYGGVFNGELYNEGGTVAGATLNCMLMSNSGAVTLDGVVVDEAARTVTITTGKEYTTDDLLTVIPGEDYTIVNEGAITGGEAVLPCDFSAGSTGSISGGSFSGTVYASTVSGGAFTGAVTADTVASGTFSGRVNASGCISGGHFSGASVVTGGEISGGTFDGEITSADRVKEGFVTITGGTFNGGVATGASDGVVIRGGTFNGNVGYCVDAARGIYDGYVLIYRGSGAEPTFNGGYVGGRNVVVEWGTFSASTAVSVYTVGGIFGGTFYGPVVCHNAIEGGAFHGKVTMSAKPNGQIRGGSFGGGIELEDGTKIESYDDGSPVEILSGTIHNHTELNPGDGVRFGADATVVNEADGRILSGVYGGPVVNYGAISRGTFRAPVTTYNSIAASNATFEDVVLNVPEATLTIPAGVRKTIAEIAGMEGYAASTKIYNNGTIAASGDAVLPNPVVNDGTIEGGSFSGVVEGDGRIAGGTFTGEVTAQGYTYLVRIDGGEFHCPVAARGDGDGAVIYGGHFYDKVGKPYDGHVLIYRSASKGQEGGGEAVFDGPVAARNLVIAQGTFNNSVELSTVGILEGGVFYGPVTCNNTILGGEFHDTVTVARAPFGQIFGGKFYGKVINKDNARICRDGYDNGENRYGPPEFLGGEIENQSTMDPGAETTFAEAVTVVNQESANILSGVYRGKVVNYGKISGATLLGAVENYGVISNSEYDPSLLTGPGTISAEIEGVKVDAAARTITVEKGTSVSAQSLAAVPGYDAGYRIVNRGTIKAPGSLENDIESKTERNDDGTYNIGTITGGAFSGVIRGDGRIEGGTFTGEVTSQGYAYLVRIDGGEFNCPVATRGNGDGATIYGGHFYQAVGRSGDGHITVQRGDTARGQEDDAKVVFDGPVAARNLVVTMGTFNGSVELSTVGLLDGGVFNGPVICNNAITGGTFNGGVTVGDGPNGQIHSGVFNCDVTMEPNTYINGEEVDEDGNYVGEYAPPVFNRGRIVNAGELDPGADAVFAEDVTVVNDGRILSGIYRGRVINNGLISGATLYGPVENHSRILNSTVLGTMSGEGTYKDEGIIVDAANKRITIESGYTIDNRVIAERIKATGGEQSEYTVVNQGAISGTATLACRIEGGTIKGGTYTGVVTDPDGPYGLSIWGGTFTGQVGEPTLLTNGGQRMDAAIFIHGGSFDCDVMAWNLGVSRDSKATFQGSGHTVRFTVGAIEGGTFDCAVVNGNIISGGVFNGPVTNEGTILSGTFNGGLDNRGEITPKDSYKYDVAVYGEDGSWVVNETKTQSLDATVLNCAVSNSGVIEPGYVTGENFRLEGAGEVYAAAFVASTNGSYQVYDGREFRCGASVESCLAGIDAMQSTQSEWTYLDGREIAAGDTVSIDPMENLYLRDSAFTIENGVLELVSGWSVSGSQPEGDYKSVHIPRGATVSAGTWTKPVVNDGKITGGSFKDITNRGSVTGATILGAIRAEVSSTISDCSFGPSARVASRAAGARIEVRFRANDAQRTAEYGANVLSALNKVSTAKFCDWCDESGAAVDAQATFGLAETAYSLVKRETPAIQWPASVTAAYGRKLGETAIPGDANGSFAWTTPDVRPELGAHSFEVTYVPKAEDYYDYAGVEMTRTIPVNVERVSVTIRVQNATKTYGDADPEPAASIEGLPAGMAMDVRFSRTPGENAGTYEITASVENPDYYNLTTVPGTLTIQRAPLPIAISGFLGDIPFTGGAVEPVIPMNDLVTGEPLKPGVDYQVNYRSNQSLSTGTKKAFIVLQGLRNYIGMCTWTFSIVKGSAVIAPNDLTKVYGEPDPALTAALEGVSDPTAIDYALAREAGEDVGAYRITASYSPNENFDITAATGTLTITAKPLPEVEAPADQTYAGVALTPKPAVRDGSKTLIEGTDYELNYANNVNAGTADVTVTGKGNYSGTRTVHFAIRKASATVAANAVSKFSGAADPALTATVTGAVNGETLNYSLRRDPGEAVGSYAIRVVLGDNPNYDVTAKDSVLTIGAKALPETIEAPADQTYAGAALTPKPVVKDGGKTLAEGVDYELSYANNVNAGTADVTITGKGNYGGARTVYFAIRRASATVAANAASKVYGAADPALTATVTGAVNGEKLNYALNRAAGEDAGSYEITVQPGSNPNYDVTVRGGTLTITAKPLPEVEAPAEQTYAGAALTPKPAVKDGSKALVEGTDYELNYANNVSAGTADVTVTGRGNYSGTRTVHFAIRKASATVAANAASKLSGAADPALTATVTGAVNGETLNYSLRRDPGEAVGSYAIRVVLGDNPNYDVTAKDSAMTIGAKALPETIEAPADQTYAGAALTPKPVVKDGGKTLAEGVDYELSYANNVNAGTANVTITGKGNYGGTHAVSFAIRRASATVAANAASKVYGAADPALTATVTGAVNGEKLNYALNRAAGENAGSYEITVQPGSNPNYDVAVRGGTLTITAKPLPETIEAPANRTYAGAALTPKPAVKDGSKVLAEGTDYELDYANNVSAGTADVIVTGRGNYSGTRTVHFDIHRAKATVVANSASKPIGTADPVFTATVTGAVNGERLDYALLRTAGEGVGTYEIAVQLGSNPNYDVTAQAGTLTITPDPSGVTLTPEKLTLTVGESGKLTATLQPAGAQSQVHFESDSAAVATVREDGTVQAEAVGAATITVRTANGKTASCAVTVEAVTEDVAIGLGEKLKLIPKMRAAQPFSYDSSDANVASVDADGTVSALKEGGAVITASANGAAFVRWNLSVLPSPDKVKLSQAKVTLGVEQTLQLSAETGNGTPGEFSWSSSNAKVASVDEKSGAVTAKKAGSAKITVKSYNGKKATCTVTVKKAPTSVKLNVSSVTLGSGDSVAVKATLSKGSVGAVSYESTNPDIAFVSEDRIMAGGKPGTATITARTHNGKTASCTVTVYPAPAEISLGDDLTLGVKQSATLNPVYDDLTARATLEYESSDKKVVSVTAKGKLTALRTGTATITVTAHNGVQGTVGVTVVKAPSKVNISAKKASVGAGLTYQLSASVPADSVSEIQWSSSKSSVASVDANGLVTAKKAGTATITAKTYNGKKATCKITVTKAPTSIKLNVKSVTLGAEDTLALKATLNKGSASAITYESTDEGVAKVVDGKIVAVAPGTATVTASTYNGKSATCTVTVVKAPTAIDLGGDRQLKVKKSLKLNPTLIGGSVATLTYSSSNGKVATVDKAGKVTAKKAGTATITVTTHNGVTASCTITVTKK